MKKKKLISKKKIEAKLILWCDTQEEFKERLPYLLDCAKVFNNYASWEKHVMNYLYQVEIKKLEESGNLILGSKTRTLALVNSEDPQLRELGIQILMTRKERRQCEKHQK